MSDTESEAEMATTTTTRPFALYPGVAGGRVLDYEEARDLKLFKVASAPLSDEVLYDCKPQGLHQFTKDIRTRGELYGWYKTIMEIPRPLQDPDPFVPVQTDNIVHNYGSIPIQHIREAEEVSFDQQGRSQDLSLIHI